MKIIGLIILIILSLLALFLAVCLFVKIRLILSFVKPKDGRGRFDARAELFGGRVCKAIAKPSSDESDSKQDKPANIRKKNLTFLQKVKKYYFIFLKVRYTWLKSKAKIRKNILAEKIEFNASFGLEDAAVTGMAAGTLWAAVYNVIAFLSGIICITEPSVNITPVYDEELIEANAECILTFRLANIISILAVIGINYYIINRKLSKKEKAAINYGNTN